MCKNGFSDCIGIDSELKDDDFRCNFCFKEIRNKYVKAGICPAFYVVAYEIARLYGGPEEGGWYYDWVNVLESYQVHDFKAGLKIARELKNKYPKPKYNRFSVLGDADVFIETFYHPTKFPKETLCKPIYE